MIQETKDKIKRILLWVVVIGLTVFGTWLLSKVFPATTVETRSEVKGAR